MLLKTYFDLTFFALKVATFWHLDIKNHCHYINGNLYKTNAIFFRTYSYMCFMSSSYIKISFLAVCIFVSFLFVFCCCLLGNGMFVLFERPILFLGDWIRVFFSRIISESTRDQNPQSWVVFFISKCVYNVHKTYIV